MTPILSILICSLESRANYLNRLLDCLLNQGMKNFCEIITSVDNGEKSIGVKRNGLLDAASGLYLCFVDDDDLVSDSYIKRIITAVTDGPDCVGMCGEYTIDGKNPIKFIHSIKYDRWYSENRILLRNPNHLNPIKSSIAKAIRFPDVSDREDRAYSRYLIGKLHSEVMIEEPIYFYLKRSRKEC